MYGLSVIKKSETSGISGIEVSTLTLVTALVIGGGAYYGWVTDSAPTYWSSALGTAAGGMVAVLAAFFFWKADRYYAAKRQETERSHQASREIHRLNRLIRLAPRNGIYDKELGFPHIDDKFRNTVDGLVDQIDAQAVWVSDRALADQIKLARKLLTTDHRLEALVPDELHLSKRTFRATRWLDQCLEKHVKGSSAVITPLANIDEFNVVYRSYEAERQEFEAAYDKWWEAEKLRLVKEKEQNRAAKAVAREQEANDKQGL